MSHMMSELTAEMEKNIRSKWVVGDWVEVYSKSRDQWFRAKIIQIYDDDDGEWLAVAVESTMIKEVQRFTSNVRPYIDPISIDDDDSDSEIESSDSVSDSDSSGVDESSDSLSYSDSDDDQKTKLAKKRKKAAQKLSKHHELILIFVERSGSKQFNGKYVYSTTTEEGYPIFEHVDNKYLLIKQNEDDMRWEFINSKEKKVFYYSKSDKEFPPSAGWNKAKFGDLPNPDVRLDQIKKEAADDNFFGFEDDPYKFSPFLIIKYKFIKVNKEPLGFDLQILQFVAVKSIKPRSQAANFGIMPGDILVSANELDLSKMVSIEDVCSAIEKLIKSLGNEKEITITFAREKKTFKVLICQRAGTKRVNGKYSIQGMENDALLFANNSNKNLKIMRIYVNEEEDEAIWALREVNINQNNKSVKCKSKKGKKNVQDSDSDSSESSEENHRDFYIVLGSAKDEIPPEVAWEAIDPHGLWPAAGLQCYDVKVVPPSKPRIIRTQPNPNAVQIRFECDEDKLLIMGYIKQQENDLLLSSKIPFDLKIVILNYFHLTRRKPKVCPHMKCWYEIEMRHYKFNIDKGKTNKKPHDRKIWKTNESPFVANRLINGDDYEFIVRSCNHIACTNSNISERVTPLQLPPKPKIIDVTGKPGELYIHFHCPNAQDREVQAKFELIIDPPIDENVQDYKIKEHRLLVDNDNKPVRLRNLINGTKYQIIVASVNTVGVTYSEPETAYLSKEPPFSFHDIKHDNFETKEDVIIKQQSDKPVVNTEMKIEQKDEAKISASNNDTLKALNEHKSIDVNDYFKTCGRNLKISRASNSVTCVYANKEVHSAFGNHVVKQGKMEWIVHIEKGEHCLEHCDSIRIGVCCPTNVGKDQLFTETQYGYGLSDNGCLYWNKIKKGCKGVEYSDGFKTGDDIGVCLDLTCNILSFTTNGMPMARDVAFEDVKLNKKDKVYGYCLAVSIIRKKHQIQLKKCMSYTIDNGKDNQSTERKARKSAEIKSKKKKKKRKRKSFSFK